MERAESIGSHPGLADLGAPPRDAKDAERTTIAECLGALSALRHTVPASYAVVCGVNFDTVAAALSRLALAEARVELLEADVERMEAERAEVAELRALFHDALATPLPVVHHYCDRAEGAASCERCRRLELVGTFANGARLRVRRVDPATLAALAAALGGGA